MPDRISLEVPLNIYCAPGQNPDGGGLSPQDPFNSLVEAYETIRNNYDLRNYKVTCRIVNGTYNCPQAGMTVWGPLFGGSDESDFLITGDPNNINAVELIGSGIEAHDGARLLVKNLTMGLSGGPACLRASTFGALEYGNIRFLQINSYHILCRNAFMAQVGPVWVRGASRHISIHDSGVVELFNQSLTFENSPSWNEAFVVITGGGTLQIWNMSISGTASGQRWRIMGPANIDASGAHIGWMGNQAGYYNSSPINGTV